MKDWLIIRGVFLAGIFHFFEQQSDRWINPGLSVGPRISTPQGMFSLETDLGVENLAD